MTYAPQDADQHDDVPGKGMAFINAFDTAGNLIGRVASKVPSALPGGLAVPPRGSRAGARVYVGYGLN